MSIDLGCYLERVVKSRKPNLLVQNRTNTHGAVVAVGWESYWKRKLKTFETVASKGTLKPSPKPPPPPLPRQSTKTSSAAIEPHWRRRIRVQQAPPAVAEPITPENKTYETYPERTLRLLLRKMPPKSPTPTPSASSTAVTEPHWRRRLRLQRSPPGVAETTVAARTPWESYPQRGALQHMATFALTN